MREVVFTDYALMRMRMRDITRGEVREALEAPRSRHFFSTKHGRMNVRHGLSVSGRTIVVSYEERGGQTVVINAVREKG
ncbi:MAG: hypothetical protein ACR2JR_15060 [Rubrobacteraceae bacterium]